MSELMKEHKERGFTLVELLVAMVIAAMETTLDGQAKYVPDYLTSNI